MELSVAPANPPADAAPPLRHDAEHVEVLRLMVTDTYRWKHDWAAWRVRFDQDPDTPGMTLPEIARFVAARAVPLCRRQTAAHDNVLYLRDEQDLVPVFDAFGAIPHARATSPPCRAVTPTRTPRASPACWRAAAARQRTRSTPSTCPTCAGP